ncbi:MAG: DUF2437 domain-containing protein, partial [Pseudonocardia sp.]|nr:DUF2437 domain-containing protein [Pseudonocardia sp.]
MRFATYLHDGTERAGVVVDDLVHPVDGTLLDLVCAGLPAA